MQSYRVNTLQHCKTIVLEIIFLKLGIVFPFDVDLTNSTAEGIKGEL